MRLLYHNGMSVLRQHDPSTEPPQRGPRARTRRLLMETATRLMQDGVTPSISEVADAAEVSRATAYRYFPSQAALVQAVVDEALAPILAWRSTKDDAEQRVSDLLNHAQPTLFEFEATFRAALKHSLEERTDAPAGEPPFKRGHRINLLQDALAPLRQNLSQASFDQLIHGLSLLFGVESLVVLKDINGLNSQQAQSVTIWAASAMVQTAIKQAQEGENN